MNGETEGPLGLAEDATGTMRAVYLPFGNALAVSADGTSFTFSETTFSYYLTASLLYSVTGGTVSGTFNMQIPDGYVQFSLDDTGAVPSAEIELREPHLTPQGIVSIAADGSITHTGFAGGAPLKGYVYDKEAKAAGGSKGYLFSGILAPEARNASTDYNFTLVSGGWQGTYYQKAFNGMTWYSSVSEGRALKMPALSDWTTTPDNKPIDLGTDVDGKRIYWASCNAGAENPEDYGGYFQWGDIEGYNDGKAGYSWRMPTDAELAWLRENCTWTWFAGYNGTDTNGMLVTSRISGFESRSIFLPAAGYQDDEGTYNAGTIGNYWSSTLYGNPDFAVDMYFDSDNFFRGHSHLFFGESVRPVSE